MKTLTRSTFENIADDVFKKAIAPAQKALDLAKVKKEDITNVILVGGSTRIPKVQELVKEFFGKEPDKSVNPDEAVAMGAAIQAGVLTGEGSGQILLLDVLPMNIGIETLGGVFTTIVEANTTIPVKKSQVFSTAADNQPTIQVNIAQGMRPMFGDNKLLGNFFLDGIAPAPRGIPQIEITVDVDANGIMTVTAQDKATGKEQHIRIEANSSLTDEEIEKMKDEAKANEEADKKRREEADKLNNADSLVFQIERSLKEFGDKLTDEQKDLVDTALDKIKDAVKEKRISELDEDVEELKKVWQPIITQMYQSTEQPKEEKPEE